VEVPTASERPSEREERAVAAKVREGASTPGSTVDEVDVEAKERGSASTPTLVRARRSQNSTVPGPSTAKLNSWCAGLISMALTPIILPCSALIFRDNGARNLPCSRLRRKTSSPAPASRASQDG
jgi:hypothetical protein